ncbi:hypothetical protein COCON_G00019170 [Conger conger]|uniref:Uncharacterized protein n=2 Tax=Conger conger TaxID=82655 RepID=A0A9Q1I9W3_CONCO|nr:hypothetical protein COCON_G00019170 [Conger conger]
MVPTTVAPTTTPKTTPKPTTPGNNGKKCHKLSCTGEKCYTKADQKTKIMLCPVGQDYCWLKKTVSGSVMTWVASCSKDCREEEACTSTAVDCTQECCNATKASSCLKLDGTLNTPNSLAPHLAPVPVLSLLAAALLAWLAGSQIHAQ